ncbi:MAG TPA: hypothetical protein VK131_01425, partial [Candidatus Acidoferrales bacterium]|nr:hypothetical protein [Candidatus Acidoferrales bacterium]
MSRTPRGLLERLAQLPPKSLRAFATDTRVPGIGLGLVLVLFPLLDPNKSHVNVAADAGTFILLALGLNIVVGFAGLLDLGYAAF